MYKRIKNALGLLLVSGMLIIVIFQENGYIKAQETKEFTAFFAVPGNTKDDYNEVQELIADITGAKCQEIWLVGQTQEEAIASYIASGEYPDFISGCATLYDAGALIPIDEYWDNYPNIRSYMSDGEWDRLRQADGHIYWIPQFGIVKGEATEVVHEGEAFWIQTRVLKWAGYPKISTVEEYFALIEAYMEANPCMESGEENIPFTILCDDWRYFCLENPPQFLDGYPNDGSCEVEPETLTVIDYNVTPTARRYFSILNEAYHAGMIDPESFTQTYSEYLEKLASGRVLGMVDQWWQFSYDVNDSLARMSTQGCSYVPLPVTIETGIKNQWHVKRGNDTDIATGLAITTGCEDIAGALQFVNDLLDDEVLKLRFWGVEGVDYEVDENGVFYRTEEQRLNSQKNDYMASHFCFYPYFPRLEGILEDGKNAFSPEYQPEEFLTDLPDDIEECFAAYGCQNYVDMLGTNEPPGAWYPMYSHSDTLTSEQEAGRVWRAMTEVKQEYLPMVIMTDNFEEMWEQYMQSYEACHPEIFFEEMQREVDRRVAIADEVSPYEE